MTGEGVTGAKAVDADDLADEFGGREGSDAMHGAQVGGCRGGPLLEFGLEFVDVDGQAADPSDEIDSDPGDDGVEPGESPGGDVEVLVAGQGTDPTVPTRTRPWSCEAPSALLARTPSGTMQVP